MSTALPSPQRFAARVKPTAKPWKGILAVADAGSASLTRTFVRAARSGREALSLSSLESALVQHDWQRAEQALALAVAKMAVILEQEMSAKTLRIMAAGGEAALKALPRRNVPASLIRVADRRPPSVPLNFNLNNPEALRWARTRSATMVREINAATREAIRIAIARSFSEGIPVRQVAAILRSIIGLDTRRVRAVLNLRQRIEDSPGGKVWAGKTPIRVPKVPSDAFINAKAKAYAERLLTQRAQSIARTEAIAASNEGQRQAWLQAVEKDLLFNDELRVWIITGDKRLCPQCESAAGDLAPLDKPFPNGSMGPPLHPMCRCTTGISGKRGKKSIRVAASIRKGVN